MESCSGPLRPTPCLTAIASAIASTALMEAKLIIVGGKANKRDVRLKLPTVIGRSREADLTVAHPMISRRHCELSEADGVLKLKDLGSLNGTFVGGERIDGEVTLRPDDEFTVGPLTFRVEYEYTGEMASGPPGVESIEQPDAEIAEALTPETDAGPDEPVLFEEETPIAALDVETEAAPEPEEDDLGFELSEEVAEEAASGQPDESPWAEAVVEPATPPDASPPNGEPDQTLEIAAEQASGEEGREQEGEEEEEEQALGADLDEAEDAALRDFLKGLQ